MVVTLSSERLPVHADDSERHILRELVDALIQENLFRIQDRAELSNSAGAYAHMPDFELSAGEYYLHYPLNGGIDRLVFRVRKQQQIQPYRLSRPPVLLMEGRDADNTESLDAARLMQCLIGMADCEVLPDISGLDRFMHDLAVAEAQTHWALENSMSVIAAVENGETGLLAWERLASLRDRPFHPLARAKTGWGFDQHRRYSAESGQTFGLAWLAVRNARMLGSPELKGMAVADAVLETAEKAQLLESMEARRIDPNRYSLLPVHPWQRQHILKEELANHFSEQHYIVVADALGRFAATSSVRSLVPIRETAGDAFDAGCTVHLKLPLAISSLGALRILPPRYLHNGAAAQILLETIIEREPDLNGRVFCCDEKQWVGVASEGESMLSDRPGHLTCLLRRYPQVGGPECRQLPMSALTVVDGDKVPAFECLLRQRGETASRTTLTDFFQELCERLCGLCFICFGYGVMPEVHGQNIVLAVEQGRIAGLILRDHDTLRFFPPWLKQAGIDAPQYIMDWSTPNSLVCLSPQELLSYFQTLAVQVNLYAVADALAQAYGIEPEHFWRTVKEACQRQLQRLHLSDFVKALLRKELLDNPVWPTRLLLTPYLVRRTRQTGMPSGVGSTRNPLMEYL